MTGQSEDMMNLQHTIIWLCLGISWTMGIAGIVLHLRREYRQYKTKQRDIYPAVGWQTTVLPGPKPPIASVERLPTRPLEVPQEAVVKPLYEQEFDEIMYAGLEKWKEIEYE